MRQDWVKISGGQKSFREVVEHPGAVAVLVLNDMDEVVLVRQHRQPVGEIMLEIPAGKLEPNEEPLVCAQRELLEETGMVGAKWKELCVFYPSPGFCDEVIHLFQAEGLSRAVSPTSDPEEKIEVSSIAIKEAWALIERREIKDGKTIIALQFAIIQRT